MNAGTATANIVNGGTSTIAGATFSGSFTNGTDEIVLNSVTLSDGAFKTYNGTDYFVTDTGGSGATGSSGSFTVNGGSANNVTATMYVLEAD